MPKGDVYGGKAGALQQLRDSLNKRGLLDSGTSGLLESQVYADRNRQLADLFGQAKQMQRQEYFGALQKLQELYPERFEIRNIPNYLSYFNATNDYNAALQRNAATEGSRLARNASRAQMYGQLFGKAAPVLSAVPGVGPFLSVAASGLGNTARGNASNLMSRANQFFPSSNASQRSSLVSGQTPGMQALDKENFASLLKRMLGLQN